jgi:hypothetical protein
VVKPILLYCCELWGLSNCEIIERVHLKYCKLLLNQKSSTPNCMIYGELGRYPPLYRYKTADGVILDQTYNRKTVKNLLCCVSFNVPFM